MSGAVRPPSRSEIKRPLMQIKPTFFESIQECQEEDFCSSGSQFKNKHKQNLQYNIPNTSVGLKKHSCLNRICFTQKSRAHRPITRRNPKDMPEEIMNKKLMDIKEKNKVPTLGKMLDRCSTPTEQPKSEKIESKYIYSNEVYSPNNEERPISENNNNNNNNKNDNKVEDQEYMHFLLRITEDIIKNDLYTNSEISSLCNSHIMANRHRLDEKKMLTHLKTLYAELGISSENNESTEQEVQKTQKDLKNSLVCICRNELNPNSDDCECANPLRCEPLKCRLHSTGPEELAKLNDANRNKNVVIFEEEPKIEKPLDRLSGENSEKVVKLTEFHGYLIDEDAANSATRSNHNTSGEKSKTLIDEFNSSNDKGDFDAASLEKFDSIKSQKAIQYILEYHESAAYLTDPTPSDERALPCNKPKSTVSVFTCNAIERDANSQRKPSLSIERRAVSCMCSGTPRPECICPVRTSPVAGLDETKPILTKEKPKEELPVQKPPENKPPPLKLEPQPVQEDPQPPKDEPKPVEKKLLPSCSIAPDFCATTTTITVTKCACPSRSKADIKSPKPSDDAGRWKNNEKSPERKPIDETKLLSKEYDLMPEKDETIEIKPLFGLSFQDITDDLLEEKSCCCRTVRDLSPAFAEKFKPCPQKTSVTSAALPYPLYYFYPSVATQTSEETLTKSVETTPVESPAGSAHEDLTLESITSVQESQHSSKKSSVKSSSKSSSKQSSKSPSKQSSKSSRKQSEDLNETLSEIFEEADESNGSEEDKLSSISEKSMDVKSDCSSSSGRNSFAVNADDEEDKEGIVEFLDELNKQPQLTVTRSIENQVYNVTNKLRRFREVNEQRTISPDDVLEENIKKNLERNSGYGKKNKTAEEQTAVAVEFIPPQIDFSETVTGCCSFKKKKKKTTTIEVNADDEIKPTEESVLKGVDLVHADNAGELATRRSIRLSDMILYRDNLLNDAGIEKRKRSLNYIEDAAEANNIDKDLFLNPSFNK